MNDTINNQQNIREIHKVCAIELAATVIFACGTRKFRQIFIPAAIVEEAKRHFENDGDILIGEDENGDLGITLVRRRAKPETADVISSNASPGRADKHNTDKPVAWNNSRPSGRIRSLRRNDCNDENECLQTVR